MRFRDEPGPIGSQRMVYITVCIWTAIKTTVYKIRPSPKMLQERIAIVLADATSSLHMVSKSCSVNGIGGNVSPCSCVMIVPKEICKKAISKI